MTSGETAAGGTAPPGLWPLMPGRVKGPLGPSRDFKLGIAGASRYDDGVIVDSASLRKHLDDPKWIIFDCRHDLFDHARGRRVFHEGHVPGAHFLPVENILAGRKTGRNGRHPLPHPQAFAEYLARHGVDASTQIVAYDDAGGQYAARLWWMVRWIGLTNVAVLDGGYPKWIAEGQPVSNGPPVNRSGNVEARPNARDVVSADDVLASLRKGGMVLIDARAPERFRGEVEPIDPVAGHISSARNRFYKANLNADATMRPAVELRAEFEQLLNGAESGTVVHHCGSGVTACVNLLAMEYAGLQGSRLFVGSWSEWIADPTRPIARGD